METSRSTEFRWAHLAPKHWPAWLMLGFFGVMARLPVDMSLAIGRGLGHILYYVAGSRRRIAEVNIKLCFPELDEAAQRQLVRGVMASMGMSFAESALGLWGGREKVMSRCTISGVEHVEAALAQGQGVLLLGGHFMNMDFCGPFLAKHVQFDMLYRNQPNPLFFNRVLEARELFAGMAIERRDTRLLIRRLRQGKVAWYAPDQDYGAKHSVFAPFFGIPVATVTGTMRIAKAGNAAVLTLFHYRDENNHYHIEIGPRLENFPSGDDVADATRTNAFIEQSIRRYPEQYLWLHRRFKSRPDGEPSLYPPRKRRRKR